MKYLLFLMGALSVSAAQPPLTPWVLYKWGNSGQYKPYAAPDATFSFPQTGRNVAYPVFLVTTTATNLIGNLSGKTLEATLTISVTASPGFVWGGLLSGWNTGGLPANVRMFISSEIGYGNSQYTSHPEHFWWSHTWAEISEMTGTVTLSDALDPNNWSDANGRFANDPAVAGAFQAVISNAVTVGLACSGGNFFDCGVAILNGTGTATFHLISYEAQ